MLWVTTKMEPTILMCMLNFMLRCNSILNKCRPQELRAHIAFMASSTGYKRRRSPSVLNRSQSWEEQDDLFIDHCHPLKHGFPIHATVNIRLNRTERPNLC